MQTRRKVIIIWTIASMVLIEAFTIYLRFRSGITATEFNQTAPLLLQIHHMFWSVPLLLVIPPLWRKPRLSGALLGLAFGFILSDLVHHLLVLPLTVGNMGWHWP
jgi:hypothetical protein